MGRGGDRRCSGFSYVTLRLSTLALAAAGAVGLYGLCRTLGASRQWSAVAAAAWLFNPLAYVLANSFMSDASFAGLLVGGHAASTCGACAANGRCPGWCVAGSAVAAAAFLFRQQGALIPVSVVALPPRDGPGPPRPGRAAHPRPGDGGAGRPRPSSTTCGCGSSTGCRTSQRQFTEELGLVWRSGTPRLLLQLLAVMVVYGGLFVLPVAASAAVRAAGPPAVVPPAGMAGRRSAGGGGRGGR